jgi:hypothetical protein
MKGWFREREGAERIVEIKPTWDGESAKSTLALMSGFTP